MYHKPDISALGGKILFHRRRLGLTQAMLAAKLCVSYQAISAWENSTTLPDITNLCRLSELFGVAVDELLKSDTDAPTLLLGVDGGGTKTEFLVFDQWGAVRKQLRLSGTNAALVGLDKTLDILREGIDQCLDAFPEIRAAHLGLAGSKLDTISKKLQERYLNLRITVSSDAVNAFHSAEGDFALICGTGSILVTKTADGRYRSVGGWGAKFGDPGSAYNFGRAVLQCGFAYEDGILPDDSLYRMLLEKTGFPGLRPWAEHMDTPSIAALAPILFTAWRRGSPTADRFLRSELRGLAHLLCAAFPQGGRLILCGGVAEHNSDILIPLLDEATEHRFCFVKPLLPPVYGACVTCCENMALPRDEAFEDRFAQTYSRS
jgi:N-acetylglucosamine kinase-like BadF-type ATPase